jgi:hypothetical protein
MESARDKAIELLMELVDPNSVDALTRVKATRVVDAIIEAARSSESAHTRAVALDVRGTAGGKATTETSK